MGQFFIESQGLSNIRTGASKAFNTNPLKSSSVRKGVIPAQKLVTLGYVKDGVLNFYAAFRLWNGFKYVDVSASTLGYRYSSKAVPNLIKVEGCKHLEYLVIEGRDIFVDNGEGDEIQAQFDVTRQADEFSGYHIKETSLKDKKMLFNTKDVSSTILKYLILQSEGTEDFKNEHPLPEPNSYEFWAAKEPTMFADWLKREQARYDAQGKGQKVHPELLKLAPKATTKKTTKKK